MSEPRPMSIEFRQAMGWVVLVAQCAREPDVTTTRVAVVLLRTPSVAELCTRIGIDAARVIAAIEDPVAPSFEDCTQHIQADLAARGVRLGSREHLGDVQPVPFGSRVQQAMRAAFEVEGNDRAAMTPLSFLRELLRTDAVLAARLAENGLSAEAVAAAAP